MNYYIIDSDANKYESLGPVNIEETISMLSFDGTPKKAKWFPVKVQPYFDTSGVRLPKSDFPCFTEPAFSRKAIEVLRDLLEPNGEILPIICDKDEYFTFNTTRIIDALNFEKSDVKYFKSSGGVMRINKFVFKKELQLPNFFRIPQVVKICFVDDEFKKRVEEHNLVGFVFKPIELG